MIVIVRAGTQTTVIESAPGALTVRPITERHVIGGTVTGLTATDRALITSAQDAAAQAQAAAATALAGMDDAATDAAAALAAAQEAQTAAQAAGDAIAAAQPQLDAAEAAEIGAAQALATAQTATTDAASALIAATAAEANAGDALASAALAMPALLHDTTHGIPLDRLTAAAQPFDISGATDQRAKLNAALLSAEGQTVLLPRRALIRLVTQSEFLVPPGGLTIKGQGGSVLWQDENSHGDKDEGTITTNGHFDLFKFPEDVDADLALHDVELRGSALNQLPYQGTVRLINSRGRSGRFTARNLRLRYPRALGLWLEGPLSVDIDGLLIERSLRGGAQIRCSRGPIKINDYHGLFTRDDFLNINWNWHSRFGPATVSWGRDVRLTNGRLYGAGGVRLIGFASALVDNLSAEYSNTHILAVGLQGDGNPVTGRMHARGIHGRNAIRPDAPYVHGSEYTVLRVRGSEPRPGTAPAIPGRLDPATGTLVQPWDWESQPAVAGNPVPVARDMIFEDVTYTQTIPPGRVLTMWEGHVAYQNGSTDGMASYAINDGNLRPQLALIEAAMERVVFRRMQADGLGTAITVNLNGMPDAVFQARFEDIRIRNVGGDVVKYLQGGIRTVDVTFEWCDFDLDPYQTHAQRAAGGGWLNQNDSGLIFNTNGQWTGLKVLGCRFANFARIFNNSGAPDPQMIETDGNVIAGQFAATGWHADNKGAGNVIPAGTGFRHEVVDATPTSPTYGQTLFRPLAAASAMPTTGSYVTGHYVRNTGSTRAVLGWHRATTGSAHVLGTDWIADLAAAPAAVVSVTGSGNATATLPSASVIIVRDTAVLTQARTLTIPNAPLGTILHYLNRTTGGFTRAPIDAAGATLAVTSAGGGASLASTGTGWDVLP